MTIRRSAIPILTTLLIRSSGRLISRKNLLSKFVFGKNQELRRTRMHFLISTRPCTTNMVWERNLKWAHSTISHTYRLPQILRCLSTLNSPSKPIASWFHCKNKYISFNIECVISMERGTDSSRQSFTGSSWHSASTFNCTSRRQGPGSLLGWSLLINSANFSNLPAETRISWGMTGFHLCGLAVYYMHW